jgi:predicted RNA methylase
LTVIKTKRIDADVLAMLSRIRIDNNVLCTHEAPQMDRDLYVRFNKVVEALGGKWKRGKGHVFAEEVGDRIDAVIETGAYACPKLNEFDFFPTPQAIAFEMVATAAPQNDEFILEPSAGHGAILLAIAAREKTLGHRYRTAAVELSDQNRAVLLRDFPGVVLLGRDFMEESTAQRYDVVLMNPPFAKRRDILHITRAWEMVSPGGRLVAIAAAGVMFRQDKLAIAFRELVEEHGDMTPLPEGTFKESGTGVNTVLVVLRK